MPENDPHFAAYKPIRNKLRKLNPHSILKLVADKLFEVENRGIEVMRHFQPWNMLLLLRWSIQEIDTVAHRRPDATQNDFHQLLNQIHEMDALSLPDDYEHVILFLRTLSYQQFALQRGPDGSAIARMNLLFGGLKNGHEYQTQFKKQTGISILDCLDLCYATATIFIARTPSRTIQPQLYRLIKDSLPPSAIEDFLVLISTTPTEVQSRLANDPDFKNQTIAEQSILPSPFLDTPIIRVGQSKYRVLSPRLVLRRIESVIYRTLKTGNPSFGVKFGRIFEAYVHDCLRSAEVDCLSENQLNRTFGGEGKCVDFLIREDECNILIDAKGVEANLPARIARSTSYLISKLRTSVQKGIEQGMETQIRALSSDSLKREIRINPCEPFLLIVTYDHLHLGSSYDLESILGDSMLSKLREKYGDPLPVPLGNIFFASIEEFEDLLSAIRTKEISSFGGFFRYAREQDLDPRTRKMDLYLHLAERIKNPERLPILQESLTQIARRVILRIPDAYRNGAKTKAFLK
ncbi:GapS1 family protein [Pelagicoccus albus]|uniref:Nuclease-related domain-containing protein n=1 Tax=Pelagicoccus albus TaxID=415222 RepID=A0A7X1B5L7_9BACT|nr:hypothetical protein [Pelagicoccus albus]MBC2606091.1 hypothetical protein [Pelagicoccus albus]